MIKDRLETGKSKTYPNTFSTNRQVCCDEKPTFRNLSFVLIAIRVVPKHFGAMRVRRVTSRRQAGKVKTEKVSAVP